MEIRRRERATILHPNLTVRELSASYPARYVKTYIKPVGVGAHDDPFACRTNRGADHRAAYPNPAARGLCKPQERSVLSLPQWGKVAREA